MCDIENPDQDINNNCDCEVKVLFTDLNRFFFVAVCLRVEIV